MVGVDMNINYLIKKYSTANLMLDGIYRVVISPGSRAIDQTTMEGVCGLVFPIRGRARFVLEKQEYILEPGKVLHAGSKMELDKEVLGEETWEYILMHYRVLDEEGTQESLFKLQYSFLLYEDQWKELKQLLERLYIIQRDSKIHTALASKVILYEIISRLLYSSWERKDKVQKDSISLALDYIHNHLEQNPSIQILSDYIGMKPKQLYYYFQKKTGMSPKQYIMNLQIKRAKEMISQGNHTMQEISELIGYEDSLYFSRIFKKYVGVSPMKFREQFGKNPY